MYKVIKSSIVCAIVIISFTLVIFIAQAQIPEHEKYYNQLGFPGYHTLENTVGYLQSDLLINDSQNFTHLIAGYYQRPTRNGWVTGSGAPVNYATLLTLPAECQHLICCPTEAISYWSDFWVSQWYCPIHVMFDWCLGIPFTLSWE